MRKKAKKINLLLVMLVLLLAGCGKKTEENSDPGAATAQNENKGEEKQSGDKTGAGNGDILYDAGKVMSADEIIAEAENAHYLSGDAEDEALYEGTGLLLGTTAPAFVQTHSLEEFPVYEGDKRFFTPGSEDYLIGSFEPDKTTIYEFTSEGSLLSLRGRIVYASEEELLSANQGKDLKADVMNEEGYTYHGNVLYYEMGEEDLFSAGFYTDKYDLLKIASTGYWDSYLYWFSMPYETEYVFSDPEGWETALAEAGVISAGKRGQQDNKTEDDKATDSGSNASTKEGHLSEKEAAELFRALMTPSDRTLEEYGQLFSAVYTQEKISAYYRAAYRLPEEFDHSELDILLDEPEFAYVVLYSYSVPKDYKPMDKIDNFLFAVPVCYEPAKGGWVLADNAELFEKYTDAYYKTVLTDDAYNAYASGEFFRRFGVPFDTKQPQICEGVFVGRVMEAFTDGNGNLCVTIYFSNDTDEDVTVAALDDLVLTYEGGFLTEISADINETIAAHSYLYDIIPIPFEYLETTGFSNVGVQTLQYTIGQ